VSETTKTHYAIVGAGPAGLAAAEAIREVDRKNRILLINGETAPPYCRPLVIKALTGERELSGIGLRDPGWYESNGISLENGQVVARLEPDGKRLVLASGKTVEYDKLLLATGSLPARPPIPGLEDVTSHTLYCSRDVELLAPLCKPGGKALVLGIGLIGLQALSALKRLGLDVVAVEMKEKVLPLILDRVAARLVRQRLEANGIEVHTGTPVVEFARLNGTDPGFVAVVEGGGKIAFDILVLATGMNPNTSLLDGTGIQTGERGGIRVSPTMETRVSGIYAAGDVTEYHNWIEGGHEIHAHWVNAHRQGRIAGLAMAGESAEPYEPVFLNSLNVFSLPIITLGSSRIDEPEGADVYVGMEEERPAYRRLVVKDEQVVAATFVNDVERAGVLQYLVRERVAVSGALARSLLEGGIEGVEFLDKLHRDAVRGDLEWPASMDLIDKFRKNMSHTRWGGGDR